MHLICLGVVQGLVLFWLSGSPKSDCCLSACHMAALFDNLVTLISYAPREFARKPRSLLEWQCYEATEFRLLLVYVGLVVIAGNVSEAA